MVLGRQLAYFMMSSLWVSRTQWRRPGAEFGGTEKFFADLNDVFSGNNFHFHAKKFHFFSNRPGFPDFTFLYCIKCSIVVSSPENHYFRKEFLDNTIFFTVFVLSRASDNTTSLNI